MPGKRGFSSRLQQRFMFAKHPKAAQRMQKETPPGKKLPAKAKPKPKAR